LSSMMRVFTFCHRSKTGLNLGWPKNLPTNCFVVSFPRPIPAHEWSVHPPIFTEAIPVDAVMASWGEPAPPQNEMISL
ncbi:hypothetical protein BKA70DRAFT_1038045, partial [Coprinopsis sp. MPI-PUGE-AT-0042]